MIFGIWNPRWWNPESKFDLESGIQRVQNPEFTFLTEYFLKKVREVLKALQPISFYSSCSFQNSLYVQLTRKRFQNENLFKKCKCCQNKEKWRHKNITMLFARVKNHCKNNAFEKLKLNSNDLGLSWNLEYKRVESGKQRVRNRNLEDRNPESSWSESRIQNLCGFS